MQIMKILEIAIPLPTPKNLLGVFTFHTCKFAGSFLTEMFSLALNLRIWSKISCVAHVPDEKVKLI